MDGEGIQYEADPKHRDKDIEYFGFGANTKGLMVKGDKNDNNEDWEDFELDKGEAKTFRGLAARLNFMSLDCPDLQFPIKASSQAMAKPTQGSWRLLKKVA